MSKSMNQITQLLDLAQIRPLSDAEQNTLNELLDEENGRLIAAAHRHLSTHYQATGNQKILRPSELKQISAKIEQQVAQRSNISQFKYLFWQTTKLATLMAGILAVLWFVSPTTQTPVEPIVPTTPRPTLPANHVYVDLLHKQPIDTFGGDAYRQTISEALTEWNSPLLIPQHTVETWQFAGAQVNQTEQIFEMAFSQKTLSQETVWILSQTPANESLATAPVAVTYQPLPRIDQTNFLASEEVSVGNSPAYIYKEEYVYRNENNLTEWVVYNSVTWQQDGQRLTLTLIGRSIMPSSILQPLAENLALRLID